eukprot:comp11974_c0_seq1/m.6667 comp11974_c0_seq1/g.6667  ORF comp11974_c0_seq1/g.6667 comp11974_c0_seq1/m.6667 type:complete len:154 (-) comp11974_c0_seq1:183-644(-)
MDVAVALRRPVLSLRSLVTRGMMKTKKSAPKKTGQQLAEEKMAEKKAQNELLGRYMNPPPRPAPTVTPELLETRAAMAKAWARHCMQLAKAQQKAEAILRKRQEEALIELRRIDERLYQQAIRPYKSPYPMIRQPPLDTPPILGYRSHQAPTQ